ncbi:hypothetical protein [Stutzerimonas balearica]|uniref:hypothetical protein n=1 Tax=Stutzerimonas balearica TaxID=74829 RepID=UPI0028B0D438|nr:hypothetical protein [Stutzerimonas balearica]
MTISTTEMVYCFFNTLWISCRSTGTQRQYSPYFFNQYEQEIRRVTSDLINTAVAPKPRPVSPNPLRHVHSLLVIGLSYSMLAGCASLTGNRFTLEGQLPANFAIRAQAHYGVANSCDGRSQTRSFERDFEDTPHAYRFRIPVSYRDGLCEMQLARVGLFIHGRYGDKDWQRTYDNGGLLLVDTLPEGAPGFDASGTLSKTAECTWLFQLSRAQSRQGEISKLLICENAGAYLPRLELPAKHVQLSFKVNSAERPSRKNTWINTPTGWKPCLPKPGWQQCQDPPSFSMFKINEKKCTVYPDCTEQSEIPSAQDTEKTTDHLNRHNGASFKLRKSKHL